MTDATSVGLLTGTSALINTVYAVQNKRDPIPILVGSGVMFAGLTLVGGLTGKWQLASAFAWVFLIASLLTHGTSLIRTVDGLANAKAPISTRTTTADRPNGTTGFTGKGVPIYVPKPTIPGPVQR